MKLAGTVWFYMIFYVVPLIILPWLLSANEYLVFTNLHVAPRELMVNNETVGPNDSRYYYRPQFPSKYTVMQKSGWLLGSRLGDWFLWPLDVFQIVEWGHGVYTFMGARAAYMLSLGAASRCIEIVSSLV